MRAAPEPDMLDALPSQIEGVGVGELGRVAVRRSDDRDDELAAPDRLAAELDVDSRPAGDRALDRTVVTQ